MLLNNLGEPSVGHGIIKPLSLETMRAQLEKRARDTVEYNKRILQEFKKEQPQFYRILMDIVDNFIKEYLEFHEIEDTESWEIAKEYWEDRLTFMMAFEYKLISLQIENQFMNGEIVL